MSDINSFILWLSTNLNFYNSIVFSRADNFNDDYTTDGLPLGADFNKYDITLGLRWEPKEDITVEPRYGFFHYNSDTTSAKPNRAAVKMSKSLSVLFISKKK